MSNNTLLINDIVTMKKTRRVYRVVELREVNGVVTPFFRCVGVDQTEFEPSGPTLALNAKKYVVGRMPRVEVNA